VRVNLQAATENQNTESALRGQKLKLRVMADTLPGRGLQMAPKESKEPKEQKEPKAPKEPKEPKTPKEPKVPKEPKEPKAPKEPKGGRD
jgi:outer membrane biosynthesis protein TonB